MALILIAGDSASERQRLREILAAEDHVVVEADNGRYCLELIEVHRIDCALLDLCMPGVEEFELLQALHKQKIPAIAIALSENPCDRVDGAFAVVGKSSSAAELRHTLAAALGLEPLNQPIPDSQISQTPPQEKTENWKISLSINTLMNLIGIGIEQAAETLNELTDCPIEFQTPKVQTTNTELLQEQLHERFGTEPICAAQLPFSGGFSGTAQLFFPTDSAQTLTAALTGEEPESPDFDQAIEEMLTEVGNIVLNCIMGTMSNAMTQTLSFSVPSYIEDTIDNLLRSQFLSPQSTILLAQAFFQIEELQVAGDIILFFKVD